MRLSRHVSAALRFAFMMLVVALLSGCATLERSFEVLYQQTYLSLRTVLIATAVLSMIVIVIVAIRHIAMGNNFALSQALEAIKVVIIALFVGASAITFVSIVYRFAAPNGQLRLMTLP